MRRVQYDGRFSLIRRAARRASYAITTVQIFISLFKKRSERSETRKVSPPIRRGGGEEGPFSPSSPIHFETLFGATQTARAVYSSLFDLCFVSILPAVVNAVCFQVTQTSISPLSILSLRRAGLLFSSRAAESPRIKIAPYRRGRGASLVSRRSGRISL